MNSATDTSAVTAATTNSGNGHTVASYLIPFTSIEISKWNRSQGIPLDDKYIKELADDIKHNGLLHPVTLVKTADGSRYTILAGANRVGALKLLRGDGAGLSQTEFRLRDDMDEDNPRCLDVSLAENHHRRASSVYETALYVHRLIDDQKVDQAKLGKMLGLSRPRINRLQKLVECYSALPASWQTDLSISPTAFMPSGTLITFTHWYEAAGKIDNQAITPELSDVLETAKVESWSTRQLSDGLQRVISGQPVAVVGTESGASAAQPAPGSKSKSKGKGKGKPLALLTTASDCLRQSGELLKADHAADAALLLQQADALDVIVARLQAEFDAKTAQLKADADAKKAAAKAGKKAAAEAKKAAAKATKNAGSAKAA